MEGLRVPIRLFFIFFAAILILVPNGANGYCNMEVAERGTSLCRNALDTTLRDKVTKNTREIACCIADNYRDCVQHAIRSAHCMAKDDAVVHMVDDKLEEAQQEINRGDRFIGNFICEPQSLSQCRHLSQEFERAKRTNQAPSNALITPFLALTCSLLATVLSKGLTDF